MNWLPRLVIATLLSATVAVALSFLPQLEKGWNMPALHSVKAQPVTEDNIVDVMSKMQLHERIRRVEVTRAIVSVDLVAASASGRSEIVRDIYEIQHTIFSHSTNINQVLMRVMDNTKANGSSSVLLLAADARREKWLSDEPGSAIQTSGEIELYLQSHFRMTYTPNWTERFDIKS